MQIATIFTSPLAIKRQTNLEQPEHNNVMVPGTVPDVFSKKLAAPRFAGKQSQDTAKLLQAVSADNITALKALAKPEVDLNACDDKGWTPVTFAAAQCKAAVIEELVKMGAELRIPNSFGIKPIQFATINGHTETVKVIAQLAPNLLTQTDKFGTTLLDYAAMYGHTETAKTLALLKPDLLIPYGPYGITPLQYAVMHGHTETAKALAQLKPDLLTQADSDGRTPLHYAAMGGYAETAKTLARLKPALLAQTDKNGATPLHYAALGSHMSSFQILALRDVMRPKVDDSDEASRRAETAKTLAQLNPKMQTQSDNEGANLMTMAASHGYVDVIRMLTKELKVSIHEADERGYTPMTAAAASGKTEVIDTLEELGANIYEPDGNGLTPMTMAALKNQPKVITLLDQLGANIHESDTTGQTPMTIAARNGNINALAQLVKLGCFVDKADRNGTTPMEAAIANGQDEAIQLLKDLGASQQHRIAYDPGILGIDNAFSYSALTWAAANGRLEAIKDLKESGASLDEPDKRGFTAVTTAVANGQVDALCLLIKLGAKKNEPDKRGYTPMTLAAARGNIAAIRILVELSANVNAADKNGLTPIIAAIKHGKTPAIEFLHNKCNVDINASAPGSTGQTPLTAAIQYRKPASLMELLRSMGADLTKPDSLGKTPLQTAWETANSEAIEWIERLIEEGNVKSGKKSSSDKSAADKQTKRLFDLVQDNKIQDSECSEKILAALDKGASLFAADEQGKRPIDYIKIFRGEKFLERLILRKAGVESEARGADPLNKEEVLLSSPYAPVLSPRNLDTFKEVVSFFSPHSPKISQDVKPPENIQGDSHSVPFEELFGEDLANLKIEQQSITTCFILSPILALLKLPKGKQLLQ